MKDLKILLKYSLLLSLFLACGACTNDDSLSLKPESESKSMDRHTIPMTFVGELIDYDQSVDQSVNYTRATTSTSWNNGDKLYLTFYNGTTIIPGEAIYDTAAGWSVSYEGELAIGNSLKCEARHFVNTTQATQYVVTLNAQSEIYEDASATYSFIDGSLTVQAQLAPKTGRIRFTSNVDKSIFLTGITIYSSYTPTNNTFYTSETMITTQSENGSTPYIYGFFTEEDRRIGIIGEDYAFTRLCTDDMLKTAESGYMAIPSEASHNNWRSGLYVKASGVEFKMIPVDGYASGFFLIGETEVTEALYNTVNGTSSSSLLPISNIAYSQIFSFIEKLNNTTKLNFALPTRPRWEYAAKGGKNSQNYTYCGSNTPGDVAWYSANTSSKQKVKTKAPNELGIYDMSGNVAELLTDSYTDGAYSYNVVMGGGYISSASYIEKTSSSSLRRNEVSPSVGFRLIMTCP